MYGGLVWKLFLTQSLKMPMRGVDWRDEKKSSVRYKTSWRMKDAISSSHAIKPLPLYRCSREGNQKDLRNY